LGVRVLRGRKAAAAAWRLGHGGGGLSRGAAGCLDVRARGGYGGGRRSRGDEPDSNPSPVRRGEEDPDMRGPRTRERESGEGAGLRRVGPGARKWAERARGGNKRGEERRAAHREAGPGWRKTVRRQKKRRRRGRLWAGLPGEKRKKGEEGKRPVGLGPKERKEIKTTKCF
jgi:hypothetical protein